MNELKPRIHADQTGLDYVLAGDYYIPDIELPGRAGCESFSEFAQIPSGIPMEQKNADQILVVEDGRIVQTGTHSELTKNIP